MEKIKTEINIIEKQNNNTDEVQETENENKLIGSMLFDLSLKYIYILVT